jgi:leucyl-tRNA synthetase
MPIDLYVGGAEHAVLHLLYARFWHKVLYDRGVVSTNEPFRKLVNQGMILGEIEITGYQNEQGDWISADRVTRNASGETVTADGNQPVIAQRVEPSAAEKSGDRFVLTSDPAIGLESRAYKMSKSRGNVINPDDIVREYGADSLRLYEMYMGPLEAPKPWNMDSVNGVYRFLCRAWRMVVDQESETATLSPALQDVEPTEEQLRVLHKTIATVTNDTETLSFNTAIARMMEFVNFFTKASVRPKSVIEQFVLLLSPYAPHIAEEMWQILGHQQTLAYQPWPSHDESLLAESAVEIPVQVNGKLRGKVVVPAEADQQTLQELVERDGKVQELLAGKNVVKTVVVPGRLVNFVIK